jgi:NADH:ubiquinone oxidoreductase subunit
VDGQDSFFFGIASVSGQHQTPRNPRRMVVSNPPNTATRTSKHWQAGWAHVDRDEMPRCRDPNKATVATAPTARPPNLGQTATGHRRRSLNSKQPNLNTSDDVERSAGYISFRYCVRVLLATVRCILLNIYLGMLEPQRRHHKSQLQL